MGNFTDISSLLGKENNAEQSAIIDKLGIPANQKLTATEFVNLVVKPIRELQEAMGSVKDGKSAYDIALDEGYVGTISEWLASLKGVKGDSGAHVDDLVISQEEGQGTEAVMSQKAVTDKLNEKASQEDLTQLALEMANHYPQTQEAGFHVTDPQGNIGMQYTNEGLDFAKLSQHAVEVLKGNDLGGTSNVANVSEEGFFVVDEKLNVGMKVDNNGVHAKNILEFEFVES